MKRRGMGQRKDEERAHAPSPPAMPPPLPLWNARSGHVVGAALQQTYFGAPRDVVDLACDASTAWLLTESGTIVYTALDGTGVRAPHPVWAAFSSSCAKVAGWYSGTCRRREAALAAGHGARPGRGRAAGRGGPRRGDAHRRARGVPRAHLCPGPLSAGRPARRFELLPAPHPGSPHVLTTTNHHEPSRVQPWPSTARG